jgi:hypothetical protein
MGTASLAPSFQDWITAQEERRQEQDRAEVASGIVRARKGGGAGLLNATMVIALVLALAYVVAVWAMAAKPT